MPLTDAQQQWLEAQEAQRKLKSETLARDLAAAVANKGKKDGTLICPSCMSCVSYVCFYRPSVNECVYMCVSIRWLMCNMRVDEHDTEELWMKD